jgi:hypothetical protein
MSDDPHGLGRMPSDASLTPPPFGAWCKACRGTRWWTERHEPKGWCCMTCHPPVHLRPDQIRREGEAALVPLPRVRPDPAADPLFRQAGIDLDDET